MKFEGIDFDVGPLDAKSYVDGIFAAEDITTRRNGYTGVWRNCKWRPSMVKENFPYHTPVQAFMEVSEAHPNKPFLGYRPFNEKLKKFEPYLWWTYGQTRKRTENIAAGITALCVDILGTTKTQLAMASKSENRPEWMITELALGLSNHFLVGIYNTLSPTQVEFVLNHAEVQIMFVSLQFLASTLDRKKNCPELKVVVCFDPIEKSKDFDVLKDFSKHRGIHLIGFDELEKLGAQRPCAFPEATGDDIQALVFTSGTTGERKGAIITNTAMIASMIINSGTTQKPTANKVVFSSLPLAHGCQRLIDFSVILKAAAIGYSSGDYIRFFEDLQALKPNFICTVPRILNQFTAFLKESTVNAGGMTGMISRRAYADKLARYESTGNFKHPIWDWIWSRMIRNVFGGRLQYLLVSSALISADSIKFLRLALGCDVVNGYGATEPKWVSMQLVGDAYCKGSGPPSLLNEVRLMSLPDMGYFIEDKPRPRGEICVKSPQMFRGYYKRDDLTREVFDEENYVHTGDVGEFDEFGRLHVIDRVKNLFKLAGGEYISPEFLENSYLAITQLSQAFVPAHSEKSYLVAIFGVNAKFILPMINRVCDCSITEEQLPSYLDDERVIAEVTKKLEAEATRQELAYHQRIRTFKLMIDPLTEENGLLTPNQKIKRKEAALFYKDIIDDLYSASEN